MRWHIQPIDLHVRGYPDSAGADGKECFDAVKRYVVIATVQLLGKGRANIIGHLRSTEDRIRQREYRDLLMKLRDEYGVMKVSWVHQDEEASHDTAPAPPVTPRTRHN